MANLPLAFAELLGGGVFLVAGISGSSIADVVEGHVTMHPLAPDTGSVAAGAAPGAGGTAVGPLPGVTRWERTDEGVDASATPGSPVRAIMGGVVSAILPNWYAGQPLVIVDTPGLPSGATGIYYAEQISPNVHIGQQVQAGEQIGTVAQTGTGLEIGFSKGVLTLAKATTGYVEGQVTQAGLAFRSFLKSIGVGGL
jgi:hypothetical protein